MIDWYLSDYQQIESPSGPIHWNPLFFSEAPQGPTIILTFAQQLWKKNVCRSWDLHLYNPEFVSLSLFNPSCLGGDLGSPPVILVTQNRGFEGYSLMASLGACDNKQWPFDSLLLDTTAKLGGMVSMEKD